MQLLLSRQDVDPRLVRPPTVDESLPLGMAGTSGVDTEVVAQVEKPVGVRILRRLLPGPHGRRLLPLLLLGDPSREKA